MHSTNFIGALVIVLSVLGAFAQTSDAAQAHGAKGQHGARVAAQPSGKGVANSNTQWSADPDRGWIRADERKASSVKRNGSMQHRQGKLKHNDKGKKF